MTTSYTSEPDSSLLTEYLARVPAFGGLGVRHLADLAALAIRREFSANVTLFLEHEPSAGLWVLDSGNVKISRISVDGREHILRLCGPGDSFNDISALDGGENAATATTLSECIAWIVPSDALIDAVQADTSLSNALIGVLTRRVRMLVQRIEELTLYSVPARLARFLIAQGDDPSLSGSGITRAAIAAHLATTPETVSRVLHSFEESGAIRVDRHRILIVNEEILRELAML